MEIERSRGKGIGAAKRRNESSLTRAVNAVFAFVRFAEFEILFLLFFFIAFLLFKDLEFSTAESAVTSRPEYNQILVKKPDRWRMA
ncbi:hypothetical protein V2J09_001176 [Rumex salicifolius]